MSDRDHGEEGAHYRAELASLYAAFIRRLAVRLGDIDQALDRLVSGETGALEEAYRHAHSLAGTAGSFGRHDVGDAARGLAKAIRAGAPREELAASMARLREVVDGAEP